MKEVKKDILRRVFLVYFGIALFGIAVIGKAFYIQYFEGKELAEQAKSHEMKLFPVEAMRGNISSDDGTLIATSVPNFEIRMDVSTENITDEFFSENVDSLAYCLSGLFKDRKISEYKEILWEARRNGERYLLIKKDISYQEVKQLRMFPIFRLGKFRGGLIVINHYKRELPYQNLAKRTIGYESDASTDTIKYVGLEGSFSKNLQGINGKRLMRRLGSTNWVPVDIENEVEPQNGSDIVTTIDINIQDLAESALMRELIADSADHGCVIVMEVKTGYIMSIVNLGKNSKGGYSEIFNYALGEASEPGSTFKLASFLVALEDGRIDLNTTVNTTGGVAFFSGRKMEDSHHGGYGVITAQQVFEKSSNVGTSKLIYGAYSQDPQKYIDGLYRMSLNKKLDLQIGGEGNPYIKNTQDKWWSNVSLPWMSIGYEVALTPLQLLTLYNAVANNGKMVKPILVKEILKNGQVEQTFPPEIINPAICSPATLVKVRTLLEGVVERGTASMLKNPVYKIAGKTGTAQLARDNKGYKVGTKAHYKGSFTGYFPADNPRYSIFVMIYRPLKGKYYGAQVAAPVFKEIADYIYANLKEVQNPPVKDTIGPSVPFVSPGLQKDIAEIYNQLDYKVNEINPAAQWARPVFDSIKVLLEPEIISRGVVPDVTGMSVKDAVFLLEGMGMKVKVTGKGAVVKQSLLPGKYYPKGSIIILDLSTTKV
jgi:cell division protein FtsI (penicillin-binding protein 3)